MFLLKKIYIVFLYPFIDWYIKKERPFRYKGFKLTVLPGVFHPGFFFSTKFFFSFIEQQDLENKECLEIGCGSGLLSLLMLRKRGRVTAIDIQELAIRNTEINVTKNKNQFSSQPVIIQSDLFEKLGSSRFDFVVINPPYFFAEVTKETQHAWFCGKDGEYFHKLFSQLQTHLNAQASVFMVLAENCDIARIREIAARSGFRLDLAVQKKIWWETNFIFKLSAS